MDLLVGNTSRGVGAPLIWTAHPLLAAPSPEVVEAMLESEEGRRGVFDLWRAREARIRAAEEDSYSFGFELSHWRDADELLSRDVEVLLAILGGNRAAKSEFAGKRFVETAVAYPGSIMFALRESDEASIGTVQKLIWKYLPLEVKALNGKRDGNRVWKVNYSPAGGFTEGKLVLPNGSEVWFPTYKQDPDVFEGFEIGVKGWDGRRVGGELNAKDAKDAKSYPDGAQGKGSRQDAGGPRGRLVHNIAWWADENLPLPWLKMLLFRQLSRAGLGIWTFTAVNGLTPALKQVLGVARTLSWKPAELLPGKVNVEGCPAGTMPYIQAPFLERSRVIYFHSILNPFGAAYEGIKKVCKGMPDSFVQVRAYGYARDTRGKAFPNFGEVNVVRRELIPTEGTNYMVVDPAGRRPMAALWARVAPGGHCFIYRDFPEAQRFGDWAETSANPDRLDGDRGPAQQPNGFGVEKYAATWKRLEGSYPDGAQGGANLTTEAQRHREEGEGEGEEPRMNADERGWENHRGGRQDAGGPSKGEEIFRRLIDPRAGRNAHVAEKGGTCLVDQFVSQGLYFESASGVDVEEGVVAINEWLEWDRDRDFDMVSNGPRLYVSEDCRQVIWAMGNWTGNDGDKGACKDFVDLVRYLALDEPMHVTKGMMAGRGGGAY